MFGYWALADYGRSFLRPLAWLALSVFIVHFGYALILAPLKQKVDPANRDYYDQAVWMLAVGNGDDADRMAKGLQQTNLFSFVIRRMRIASHGNIP